MTYDEYIAAVVREIGALSAAVAAGTPADPVPTCSDWALSDLVAHVGEFCAFWAHVLCEGSGREKPRVTAPPEGEELAGWLAETGGLLVAELEATPMEMQVWTWFDADTSAGFVARRAANELAVHRYDAQSARGAPEPIARELAVDGIAEILQILVTARDRTGDATGQTMYLHGTDATGAEWLVELWPDRVDVTSAHAKAELAVRGAVSDLELVLYKRPVLGNIELLGDESVLDAWYREFAF